jgi:excisionase family DNA binding protein
MVLFNWLRAKAERVIDAHTNSMKALEREWLDVRALTQYASVSERTLRDWVHRPTNPLPAAQVGNKLLVSRAAFDEWLKAHKVQPPQGVNAIVNDVMQRMRS